MSKIYFNPGCALSIYKPELAARIFAWLNENYSPVEMHNVCCRHNPKLSAGSKIINVCAGCDKRFRTLYDGISTVSLWEVICENGGFNFPDYHGAEMSIQDPCPVRDQPRVHKAVRKLLRNMNITLIEPEYHGERSVCCGDSLFGNAAPDVVARKMRERADSMPCNDVVVYCVSCVKSMYLGGKTPRYLADLLFGEDTQPQEYRTAQWHKQLDEYISLH